LPERTLTEVTEQERIDRETLLKRAAAAAGAVYVAPVLAPAASGEVARCQGQPCSHDGKCRRTGGSIHCKCVDGRCRSTVCPCQNVGPRCGLLEPCGGSNCACYRDGHYENPGHCIYLEDTNCDTFVEKHGTCPGGDDSECADGKVCFDSCCSGFGYPPLCAECCSGRTGAPTSRSGVMSGPRLHV
jgi:hypothetical protein